MSRVDCLGRSGMYEQAFMHIIATDYLNFPYVKEDFKRISCFVSLEKPTVSAACDEGARLSCKIHMQFTEPLH